MNRCLFNKKIKVIIGLSPGLLTLVFVYYYGRDINSIEVLLFTVNILLYFFSFIILPILEYKFIRKTLLLNLDFSLKIKKPLKEEVISIIFFIFITAIYGKHVMDSNILGKILSGLLVVAYFFKIDVSQKRTNSARMNK